MPKQEEIREGIKGILESHQLQPGDDSYSSFIDIIDTYYLPDIIGEILVYLHSQGVVIKVDRKRPEPVMELSIEQTQGYCFCQEDMASYEAVEPLIREGKK